MSHPRERACRACGSVFLADRRGTRGGSLPGFCSDACRKAAAALAQRQYYTRAAATQRVCRWCLGEFSAKGNAAYCCAECRRLANNHRTLHHHRDRCRVPWGTCGWCDRPFVTYPRRRYCSQRCRAAAGNSTRNNRRRATRFGARRERYRRTAIADRDGWKCQICGERIQRKLRYPHPRSLSIDHIVPYDSGGDDVKANVQASHLDCNRDKHIRGCDQLRLIG